MLVAGDGANLRLGDSWACVAAASFDVLAASLSTSRRQQGWSRYHIDEHGVMRRSVDFGWSDFPGGSAVQRAA
eukprot:1820230-Pleurochrysis_carterae.AAC.4